MSSKERICVFQCLNPGLDKGYSGRCYNKYACLDESHKRFTTGMHVLVCDRHKNKPKSNLKIINQNLFQTVLVLTKNLASKSRFHFTSTRNLKLLMRRRVKKELTSSILGYTCYRLDNSKEESLIYFFYSSCYDLICRNQAVTCLKSMGKANKTLEGPLILIRGGR